MKSFTPFTQKMKRRYVMSEQLTIFTKGSYLFRHPENPEITYQTRHATFQPAPDWVKNTPLYALLEKEKRVQIMSGQINNELFVADAVLKSGADQNVDDRRKQREGANADSEQNNPFADYTKKELQTHLTENGVDYEQTDSRARLLELALKKQPQETAQ
jgi:hypothetical protein